MNSAFLFILKLVPKPLVRFVISTGLINLFTSYIKYASLSLQDVLDEVTDNKDLQAALAFNLGDYGKLSLFVYELGRLVIMWRLDLYHRSGHCRVRKGLEILENPLIRPVPFQDFDVLGI